MSFQSLPVELIGQIFTDLGTSDESALALTRCSWVCRYIRVVAVQSFLWQPIYDARYTASDQIKEARRLSDADGDYYKMYIVRRQLDQQALQIVDDIVQHNTSRCRAAEKIAYELGVDVYDALRTAARRTWPAELIRPQDVDVSQLDALSPIWLSRPHWAQEALGVIARLEAIRVWSKVVLYPDYVSYAEGLSAFSAYRGVPPSQVMASLRVIGAQCERHLRDRQQVLDSADPRYNAVELSREICAWMLSQGFNRASAANYHQINNHFLDAVLTTNQHTLPLSLVAIFVVLARHVGLDASPVGFPQHVHAVIPEPSAPGGFIHLDIFNSQDRLVLPFDELIGILDNMGVSVTQRPEFLRPTTVRALCLRAAANIQQSCRQEHVHMATVNIPRFEYLRDCSYAVMSAVVILSNLGVFGGGQTALEMTTFCADRHPLDWCIIQREVAPSVGGQHRATVSAVEVRSQLNRMLSEDENFDPAVKRGPDDLPRAADGKVVNYHIGTVMRHARLEYIGVITDWNTTCEQPESWIAQMNVDHLSRGRDQPFYTVHAIDGTVRYVAEENVELHTLPEDIWGTIRDLVRSAKDLEKHFDRVEVENGVGRFIMGSDLRRQYPGDAVLCERALGRS